MSFQRMLMLRGRKHYELPKKEHLFALYVPRWQAEGERLSVKDYVGNNDLLVAGNVTWQGRGLHFDETTSGNYLVSPQFTCARTAFTIIADRTINQYNEQTSLGLRMVYTLNNEYATDSVSMRRAGNEITCEVGGRDNRINMSDVPQDGCVSLSNSYYCNIPVIEGGARRAWRRIDINVYHIYNANYRRPMWAELRALAIWTVQLTVEEIEQAEEYLTHVNNSRDFDE